MFKLINYRGNKNFVCYKEGRVVYNFNKCKCNQYLNQNHIKHIPNHNANDTKEHIMIRTNN
jgi:hypothetical protein